MVDLSSLRSALAAIISIVSAAIGSLANEIHKICKVPLMIETGVIDILLQRAAWTIAIIAGIISVINMMRNWRKKKKVDDEINIDV